jgi:hypothetical protein
LSHRRAIDIVLLPDASTTACAINLSEDLLKGKDATRLILNQQNRLPHISLAMGVITETDMEQLTTGLAAMAESIYTQTLRTMRVKSQPDPTDAIALVDLERTDELLAVHEQAMKLLTPIRSKNVTANDFADSLPDNSGTIDWVREFEGSAAYQRFSPHITLGYGHLPNPAFPETFLADRLAVCHLGEHCTCSEILFEVSLQPLK